MEFTETTLRLGIFEHFIRKGMSDRMAALKVIESQFDYTPHAFSGVSNNLRQYWFPFFSWAANNIPYQMKKIATEPGLYSVPAKMMVHMEKASDETPLEREFRRPWMDELLVKPVPKAIRDIFKPILKKLGWSHEDVYYWNPNLPLQDLAKFGDLSMKGLGKEVLGMMNPFAKWVLEGVPYAVGGRSMDFFTGKRLSPGDMDVAPTWMQFLYQSNPATRAPLHKLGVKVVLPAVSGEMQGRVYRDKEQVEQQYMRMRDLQYDFPKYKRGESDAEYTRRARSMLRRGGY
jgi:hypothetical protein